MASEKSACDDLHALVPADATSLDSKLRAPNSKQAFQHIEALCLGVAVVAAEHPDQFAKNLMDDHQIDHRERPVPRLSGPTAPVPGHRRSPIGPSHSCRLRSWILAALGACKSGGGRCRGDGFIHFFGERARAGRGRIPGSAANDGSCGRATRADPSGCGSNTMRSHSPTPASRRKSFGNVI